MRRLHKAKALNSLFALLLAIIMVISIVPLQALASIILDDEGGEPAALSSEVNDSNEPGEPEGSNEPEGTNGLEGAEPNAQGGETASLSGELNDSGEPGNEGSSENGDPANTGDEGNTDDGKPAESGDEGNTTNIEPTPSNEPATVNFYIQEGDLLRSRKIAVGGTVPFEYPPSNRYPVKDTGGKATNLLGWNRDGESFDFNNYTVEAGEEINLYAIFSWNYLVKYRTHPDRDTIFQARELSEGAMIPQLGPDQIRRLISEVFPDDADAWRIEYWYDEAAWDGTGFPARFEFGAANIANRDLTLVPLWVNAHMVQFETKGSYVEPILIAHNEVITNLPASTRVGYDFDGWAYDEEGTRPYNREPITASTTLYAIWTPQLVDFTIAVWLERANFGPNNGGHPTVGDFDNYVLVETVSARGAAGDETTIAAGDTRISGFFRENANNSSILKYGRYQGSETKELLGNGSTVINVFATRKVYNWVYNVAALNSGTGSTRTLYRMTVNGVTYTNTYTLSAKFEEDIATRFPIPGATVSWEISTNNGATWSPFTNFYAWTVTGRNITETMAWQSRRAFVDTSMIAANGTQPSGQFPWTLDRTNRAEYRYFVEKIDGMEGTVLTYNGKEYVEMTEYRQPLLVPGVFQKEIAGLRRLGTHNNPAMYDLNLRFLLNWNDATQAQRDNVNTIRVFFYDRVWNPITFNPNLPGSVSGRPENMPANRSQVKYGSIVGYELSTDPVNRASGINAPKPDPTFEGYTFGGWYLVQPYNQMTDETRFDFSQTMPNAALVAYAKWIPNDFLVNWFDDVSQSAGFIRGTFIKDEGDGYGVIGNSYNSPFEVGQIVAGKGEFVGWFRYVDGAYVEFDMNTKIRSTIDLYAGWNVDDFTLTYNAGRGTINNTVSAEYMDSDKYTLGTRTRLDYGDRITPPAGERLIGWTADYIGISDLDKERIYQPGEIFVMPGNVKMTAVFAPEGDLLRVIYNSNYPVDMVNQSRTQWGINNATNVALWGAIYNLSGAQLIGWDENPDATEPTYLIAGANSVLTADIQGLEDEIRTLNLYGIWRTNVYTVKFLAADGGYLKIGTATDSEHEVTGIPSGTIWDDAIKTMPIPEANENYYFVGWQQITGSGQNLNDNPINGDFAIVEDHVFVANFAPRQTVTVTSPSDSKTFDGAPLTNEDYDADSLRNPNHRWVLVPVDTATITNVGTTDNDFTAIIVDENGNDVTYQYKIIKDVGTLSVRPRDVIVTSNSNTLVYNGDEQAVTGFTVAPPTDNSGLIPGHTLDAILDGGKGTNVGNYPHIVGEVTITADGESVAGNYNIIKVDGSLTITPKPLTLTANSAEVEYNGFEQEVTGVTADGLVSGHSLVADGLTAGGVGKNVLDGAFAHTVETVVIVDAFGNDVTDNYDFVTYDGELVITPVDILIEAFINGKKAENVLRDYDGTFELTYKATIFRGDDAESYELETVWVTAPEKIDGLYPLTDFTAIIANQDEILANLPIHGNYNVVFEDATLTIEDLDSFGRLDLTALPGGGIYNGNDYFATFNVTNAPEGATLTYAYLDNGEWISASAEELGRTQVGTTVVRATLSADGYYPVTRTTFVTVFPRTIIVTANSDTFVYDGTPSEVVGISDTIGALGLAANESIAPFDTRVSGTDVGKYDHILSRSDIKIQNAAGEDTTSNYIIITRNGVLEILPLEITITPLPGEKFYGENDPENGMASIMTVNGEETTLDAFNALDMEDFWYYTDRAEGEDVRFGYPVYVSTGERTFKNYIVNVNNPENPQDVTFDIKPVPLTITAGSLTVTAGTPVSALNFTASVGADGFKFDDLAKALEIVLYNSDGLGAIHSYNTARTAGWSGSIDLVEEQFDIALNMWELRNYYFVFLPGTINVIAAPTVPTDSPPVEIPPSVPPPSVPPLEPPTVPPVVPPPTETPPTVPPVEPITEEPLPPEFIVEDPIIPISGTPPSGNGIPLFDIFDEEIPLANFNGGAWSLLNLLMSLTAGFVMLSLFGTFFRRKKQDNGIYDDSEMRIKLRERLNSLRIPALVTASIPALLFLAFENIRLPVVWITRWTPIIGAFFLLQAALLIAYLVISKRAKIASQDEEEEAPEATEA